jgi:CelD/BcsL family acetyltransferase involved in cellulose biosynthesis
MRDGVQELRTTAALEAFVTEWRAMWEADGQASPVQHPAWLMPWWRQFGTAELRAVVIRRGLEPVGLLPLYVYEEPATGERKLMPLGVGTTDYLDGVFRPECGVAEIRRAVDGLNAEVGWDALYVPQLRVRSRLAEALAGAEEFAGEPCSRMAAVSVADLPSKLRKNVGYYRKRAERDGKVSLQVAARAAVGRVFEVLVEQNTQRWQEAGEPGVLADRRMLEWHRQALPELERAGLLRLYALTRQGEVLATMYAVADRVGRAERSVYGYITSYAVAHADVAPGTILLAMAMEHAASEGMAWVDMLRGDESYKRLWHMSQAATVGYSLENRVVAQRIAA